jgi:hypothetical protein
MNLHLKNKTGIRLSIDTSEAHDVACDFCGWQDDAGGVRFVDDQEVSKVLCHQCTINLVRACLPDGRSASYETIAPATAALAF